MYDLSKKMYIYSIIADYLYFTPIKLSNNVPLVPIELIVKFCMKAEEHYSKILLINPYITNLDKGFCLASLSKPPKKKKKNPN